jgi:hypothetical protein
MDIKHTNEMRGTLLVELQDGTVFEISRMDADYCIRPDEGHREPTYSEYDELIKMYKQSDCSMV